MEFIRLSNTKKEIFIWPSLIAAVVPHEPSGSGIILMTGSMIIVDEPQREIMEAIEESKWDFGGNDVSEKLR